MDAVEAANSGHPGMPMGAAPMAYALWQRHLRHNPKDPKWSDRDRFILSAGHGSMLLYSLLHLTGYDLPLAELKNFRQLHSATPGHPENILTPGVEMATGPLGQGFAHGVGFAMAEQFLGATFNRPGHPVIDHYTYAICSDGDLMEGVSYEAASLAGHLKLGKMIYLYDANDITIDGSTELAFTENVEVRFKGLGWHVQRVDGMDVDAVDAAIREAKKADDQPSLIICRTVIGYGSPNKAGTNKSHGSPLGPDEVKRAKEYLGIPLEPEFYIGEEALAHWREAVDRGAEWQAEWKERMRAYEAEYPDEARTLRSAISGEWGQEWLEALPSFSEKMATRKAGQEILAAIGAHLPTLMGGSADLAESTFTHIKGYTDFQADNPKGRNVNYGVREHAMAAAVNGMTLHGGVRAIASSFLQFTDYCRPSIRLASLMECPSIFVFTHDSIGLGEDGPTHQPVEHLMSLRAIPNLNLFRPADGNETAAGYKLALQSEGTPTMLVLTRQGVPALTPDDVRNHPAEKGAYVLREAEGGAPKLILIGTGSEVQVCVKAREALEAEGVPTRVVSMPSWFLFDLQKAEYRESVLPKGVPAVSVEAGSTLAWPRFADRCVGLDRFGVSAPGDEAMKEFDITPEHVAEVARELLG
jgi:transketolase